MECIVLAGGLGTRLRDVIGEQPKCMAPVNGKPFLQHLFTFLQQQGCRHLILSLGYKHEAVLQWLSTVSWSFSIDFVVEEKPLGTGGGIKMAMQKAMEENVLVLNGDTLVLADLKALVCFHKENDANITLTLKTMHRFDRYGTVSIDDNHTITSFMEKMYCEQGLINAGMYAINKEAFQSGAALETFSFEKDYLEKQVNEGKLKGFVTDAYFIDIGIPSDYKKAQIDFINLF